MRRHLRALLFIGLLVSGAALPAQAQLAGQADTMIYTPTLRAFVSAGGILTSPDAAIPHGIQYLQNGVWKSIVYADNYWFGGIDSSARFAHFGTFPSITPLGQEQYGPIAPGQTRPLDSLTAANWKRVFKCTQPSVDSFRTLYHPGISLDSIPEEVRTWPGASNPHLGFTVPAHMAAFVDVNADSSYDPLQGDYPLLSGPIHIFSVTNLLKDSAFLGQEPKAVMIKTDVFTLPFTEEDSYKNRSFLIRRSITNQSARRLDSCTFGIWNDPDIGFPTDDFVGFYVTRDMAICYNGDRFDDTTTSTTPGFGKLIPAYGCSIIDSPLAYPNDGIDNDRDSTVDEPGEKIGCSSFIYYINGNDPKTGDPTVASHAFTYLAGRWRDSTYYTYDLRGATAPVDSLIAGVGPAPRTSYPFPGSSDPVGYGVGGTVQNPRPLPAWTEQTAGNQPNDRRFMMAVGPFDLAPGETKAIAYVMLVGKADSIDNGVTSLIESRDSVKTTYTAPVTALHQRGNKAGSLKVVPNPAHATLRLLSSFSLNRQQYVITDVLGRMVVQGPANKEIPIENLPAGLYHIQVAGQGSTSSTTFIKENR